MAKPTPKNRRSAKDTELHDRLCIACEVPGAVISEIADRMGVPRRRAANWVSRWKKTNPRSMEAAVAVAETVSILTGEEDVEALEALLAKASRVVLLEILTNPKATMAVRARVAMSIRDTAPADAPDSASDVNTAPTQAEIMEAIASRVPPDSLAAILRSNGYDVQPTIQIVRSKANGQANS